MVEGDGAWDMSQAPRKKEGGMRGRLIKPGDVGSGILEGPTALGGSGSAHSRIAQIPGQE
jgi:hypothetical protein